MKTALDTAIEALQAYIPPSFTPKMGIILGSGMANFAENLSQVVKIPYADIPGLHVGSVLGHSSLMLLGYLNGTPVICMSGRLHYYEGAATPTLQLFVRLIKRLGAETVIITGAVGSLRAEVGPGEVMMLSDHINMQGINPLVGPNEEAIGPRFPNLLNAYDKEYRTKLNQIALDNDIKLHEGVYISVLGPSFETPAEIRAFRMLGADVVGMSVVPEVILARHCGLKVIGLMAVANLAVGMTDELIEHEKVLHYVEIAAEKVKILVSDFANAL